MDPVIVITGGAELVLSDGACASDPLPYLRERKSRKYLGLQDALAVDVVGRALDEAKLGTCLPPERTGIYIAVGYIPFVEEDIEPVLAHSRAPDGTFSLEQFSSGGYRRAHPLLAFRCLPNMPAYHVAANFGVRGPYAVHYPSAGEFYLAFEEARSALVEHRIDVAIVLGVAHQRNLLVEHHLGRIGTPVPAALIRDAGASVILERLSDVGQRTAPIAELVDITTEYTPFDPMTQALAHRERINGIDGGPLELGPSSMLVHSLRALRSGAQSVVHELEGRDGVSGRCTWRAMGCVSS